jgi:hypothetical protein
MSRWARLLVLCAIMFACGGCLRYHAELRVDAGGTVSGRLIVAVKADLPADLVQQFDVPPSVRDRVTVREYRADGYVGSTISFDRLSVDEVGQVFSDERREGVLVQLSMARTGDRIVVTGAVSFPDLSLPGGNSGFDARIALTFTGAGSVTGNGTVSGDQVTWIPQPGRSFNLAAEAVYPQPARPAGRTGPRPGLPTAVLVTLAAMLVGGVALVGGAVLLARRLARRRVPGRGRDTGAERGGAGGAPSQPSPGWQPTLPLPTDPLPRVPAAVPPTGSADPPAEPVATQPTGPFGSYAGQYPVVPAGPGLSPESTRRLPTAPLPGAAGRPYRRDQAGR